MNSDDKYLLETARRRIRMSEIPFWAKLEEMRVSRHSVTFTWMITEQASSKVAKPYAQCLAHRTGLDNMVWGPGKTLACRSPAGFVRRVFVGVDKARHITFRMMVDVHR